MEPPSEEPTLCLGGCGKHLTSRKSRARGYGSDCWRKLHGRPALKQRRPPTPAAKPAPDQPELPYDELPLWTT